MLLFLLFPLTVILAWQDWRFHRVNLILSLCVIGLLAIVATNIILPSVSLGILCIYKQFRKESIQFIDIVIFIIGSGCFDLPIFSIYCLIISIVLVVLNKFKAGQLPFLLAWAIGFWISVLS